MVISKNRFILSFLIWIVIISCIPLLFNFPLFVKLAEKNYMSVCDDLQTKVIEFLSDDIDIKPTDSKIKVSKGKVWKEVTLELNLPYKADISYIPIKLESKFDFDFETIKKDNYYAEYYLYYKSLPIQHLKIYREHPKIAIIFDDVGENIDQVKKILDLNVPITVAILPFLNYSKRSAELANKNDMEIMLHLPMEPYHSKVTSGIHTITTDMSNEEISKWTRQSIKNVPYIKGVNNHMGSKATEDSRVMEEILKILKSNQLYFIDSRTSNKSVGFELAKKLGIPSEINKCYLDNKNDKNYIKKRLNLVIRMVLKDAKVIAIGHSSNTIKVIKEYIPEFKRKGIEFVYVSDILKR